MGIGFKGESSIASVTKKAIRIITNSNYIAHTEPLLKELELLKITCMFIFSIWKFYYKLMTNQLPVYFAIMKPVLPQVCTRYEIRNPIYHLLDIRHAFAQQSLKYCLIKYLNTEEGYADMVHNTSFKNYKMDIKHKMINNYNAACTIRNCFVCELI